MSERIGKFEWFKPFDDHQEDPYGFNDALWLKAEVDGVEYVTDRFLCLRRDMLPESYPRYAEVITPDEINEKVAGLFTKETIAPEGGSKMHPFYAAELPAAGLRFEERGSLWDIYSGKDRVGCLQSARYGLRPDELTPRLRHLQRVLVHFIDTPYEAWAAALGVEREVLTETEANS